MQQIDRAGEPMFRSLMSFLARSLSRPAIALSCACEYPEISRPFGKYWRSNPLIFLFRSTLPRAAWIAEVDLDIGREREALVVCQLLASISDL